MNDLVPGFEAKILKRATDLYGDILPQPVHDRIEEEFGYAAASDADALMFFVRDTFQEAGLDTGNVSIRDNLGASFLAYLLEINGGINPLPPHYRCMRCRHSEFDVPGNIRVGTDLPLKNCPVCGKLLLGEGFDIDPWFFFGICRNKSPKFDFNVPSEKVDALRELREFKITRTGLTDYDDFHRPAMQMTDQLSRLADMMGIRPETIPVGNYPQTAAVIDALEKGGSFVGVYALMGKFVRMMLGRFKIRSFYDLARLIALNRIPRTWLGNGENLMKNGTLEQDELLACQEDAFEYLKTIGFDRRKAFRYVMKIISERRLSAGQRRELRLHGASEWFIYSCDRTPGFASISQSISTAIVAWRLLYYKYCVDKHAFYLSFLETANIAGDTREILEDGENSILDALGIVMKIDVGDYCSWDEEDKFALMVAKEMIESGFMIPRLFYNAI